MIEPNPWELGRTVIYNPKRQHQLGGFKSADEYAQEEGVLAAIINEDVVAVKFPCDPILRQVKTNLLSWKDDAS